MEHKKLYRLTTRGLGDYHIVAKDPTEAENFLFKTLNDQDYGFYNDRKIINITLIDEEPSVHNNKPFLSDKTRRFFIVSEWE